MRLHNEKNATADCLVLFDFSVDGVDDHLVAPFNSFKLQL